MNQIDYKQVLLERIGKSVKSQMPEIKLTVDQEDLRLTEGGKSCYNSGFVYLTNNGITVYDIVTFDYELEDGKLKSYNSCEMNNRSWRFGTKWFVEPSNDVATDEQVELIFPNWLIKSDTLDEVRRQAKEIEKSMADDALKLLTK